MQLHTGDQSVLPTPKHSFVAQSLPRSAQCPCRTVQMCQSSLETGVDTLIEMDTDVNAVPHASLSEKPKKPGQVHVRWVNSKSTSPKRQCTSAEDEPMQRLDVLF